MGMRLKEPSALTSQAFLKAPTKEAGVEWQGVKNEAQPTDAEFNDAMEKGQKKSRQELAKKGKQPGNSNVRPKWGPPNPAADAAKGGWKSGVANSLPGQKIGAMRNAMKMSKLKAIVPCAISVMMGLIPIPGVGVAAAVGVFASCMLGCIMTGLGITVATLVFEICSM